MPARSIHCKEACGGGVFPWTSWGILSDIETDARNTAAATEARKKARDAYLTYRREGGENQHQSGRVALTVRQSLATRFPTEATSIPQQAHLNFGRVVAATGIQMLIADPDWENSVPYLTALQAIISGNRDRSLADDPDLDIYEAAEVLLLIEALQGPEADAGG